MLAGIVKVQAMNRFHGKSLQAAAALVACGLVFGATDAMAAVSEWAMGIKAQVRLIAERADGNTLSGAIEIVLPSGWDTYWRSPGDAGIPPTADFGDSHNLGPVALAFPVPERNDDGFAVTNIYRDRVTLPFTATIPDPSASTDLSLKLDLGVCQEVCVPDHVEVRLTVPPGADPEAAKVIAAAAAKVPGAPEPGVLAVEAAARDGGTDKRPVFKITTDLPDAKQATVFVEGPSDWFPDTPELVSDESGRAVYRVKFDRLTAKTPLAGATLRVTIATGDRAVEQTIGLD
jgi:DsbC/DsbD-like thiol-disulfide interchange protein